jgi:hypothetical protein|tara:strand:- start:5514 stop:5789 length:276 start_codon:yes stop_codon:yes gene_type:complete
MPNPIIERAARALQEDIGLDPGEAVDAARAVLRAIREPLSDAAAYLVADAEAWETGAKDHTHEVYLLHCGKLRRDVAASIQPLIDAALGEE